MSTNGDDIKASILKRMAETGTIDITDPAVINLAHAIGYGVYDELQNLEDTSGTPASTGHK